MSARYIEMSPAEIVVGTRIRQKLDDLDGLTASIKNRGHLLQPLIITADKRLVAGQRRLEAAKLAGVPTVGCMIYNGLDSEIDLLRAEMDENEHRCELTDLEKTKFGIMLEEIERKNASERQRQGGKAGGQASGKLPEASVGDTRDKVAQKIGMSGRTYEKAKEVVAAADQDPAQFGDLAEELKEPRKVKNAADELRKRRVEQVTLFLKMHPEWTDLEIAKDIKCGKKLVQSVRRQLEDQGKIPRKNQATTKKDVLLDGLGNPVPEGLKDFFGDLYLTETADELAEIQQVIRAKQRSARANLPAYTWVLTSKIDEALQTVDTQLLFAIE